MQLTDATLRAYTAPASWGDLVYVCDNDPAGKAAIKTFSRLYGKRLSVIMYTDKFRAGFDLADKMPSWVSEQNFKLAALKLPATWAHRQLDRGYALTKDFTEEWVHVIQPELYIHCDAPVLMLNLKEFDHLAACYAHGRVKVSELIKAVAHTQVQTIMYNPGLSRGFHLTAEKKRAFNIHYAPVFQKFDKEPPDVTPWEDYLTQLFPEQFDRTEVCRWIATLIVHPETRRDTSPTWQPSTQNLHDRSGVDALQLLEAVANHLLITSPM